MNRRVFVPALLAFLFLLTPLTHAQRRGGSTVDPTPRAFSIRGSLRFAQSEKPAETVKVELRRFSGDLVGAVFTRSNGEFEFSGLSTGTFYLIVEEQGYEAVRESVEVLGSSRFGMLIYLKKIGPTRPGESGDAVSVRELSLPRETRATFRKGLDTLYTKNDAAASLPYFQQVAQASPSFYEALFHMGVAYSHLNKPAEAEQAYRKSIAVSDEKYAQAFIALGSLLTTLQKAAEAEAIARRGVALDASLWQGHYEMGRALVALNRLEEAEKSLAEMVKLRNDYAPAYLLLANIHIRMKNHAALLSDLNEFLRLEPGGPQSAQARQTRDRIQRAIEDAKNAPATAPPKP
ncbi:MAG: tetratricopeptide repeat protein [Acidobacteria bacterium]|nr:tetratricopeptide repeat protein [Acidobacteriota bacterium]